MKLLGLKVRTDLINLALDREDEGRGQRVAHERLRKISAADVALTRVEYPKCRCEDKHGLAAGMTVDALLRIGSGCTGNDDDENPWTIGWVCPRLVRLRRIYGH